MNAMKNTLTCATLVLAAAGSLVADDNALTFVETLESDRNVGEWTWGNRIQERNVPAQGNPGTWRYNYGLLDFGPMANGGRVRGAAPNIFTGNWREMGVRSIGIDFSVLLQVLFGATMPPPVCHYNGFFDHGFFAEEGAGPFHLHAGNRVAFSTHHAAEHEAMKPKGSMAEDQVREYIAAAMERTDAGRTTTGAGESQAGVWLLLATGWLDDEEEAFGALTLIQTFGSIPGHGDDAFQPNPDWYEYDLEIPEEWLTAETAPEKWLIINMSDGGPPPPDTRWPDLISNVEWIAFVGNGFMIPDLFAPLMHYRVGLANPRITIAAESNMPDCSGTGHPDIYDIATGLASDCNRSGIPDSCEIALGVVNDCTGNGIPDACEAADAVYRLDSGFHDEAIGNMVDDNIIWAMRFDAGEGDVIENISVAFHGTSGVPALLQPADRVELFLWDDPSNDGSPSDAQLLVAIEREVLTVNEFFNDVGTLLSFDTFAIEPTEVSGSFFVGVMARGSAFPAMLDFTNLHEERSFSVGVSSTGDPTAAFQNATNLIATCMSGTFMIRANGNDANNTGKPDVCDPPDCLPADFNCDGVVNVIDLLIVLEGWGACVDPAGCPADLNGDGVVNVLDLLILLDNWG